MKVCVFCSFVFFCEKKYVILYLSLCHYVLKKTPVFFCHYIILSKNHTYLPLSLCHYVLKKYLSPLVLMLLCLQNHPICYSQNLFICYPVFLILSVHRPCSPVSLATLKILTENIEHLIKLLLPLHPITKKMTIRLICMSFRVWSS